MDPVRALRRFAAAMAGLIPPRVAATASALQPRPALADVRSQLLAESDSMLRLAFASGLQVPVAVVDTTALIERLGVAGESEVPLAVLAQLHADLARLLAPATPRTIHMLETDPARGSLYAILGPLPNVRRLAVAAACFTSSFVLTSLSPMVDRVAMAGDIYTLDGFQLLLTLCFLLSAAGMGSIFNALFTAQGYVADGTYDPRYDASYWIRIGLGIVAGLLLSVLVPFSPSSLEHSAINKPVLALLGGFSAGLVYRVLHRLVDTVESLFQGDRRDLQKRQDELQQAHVRQAEMQARTGVAEQLIGLRDEVAKGAPPERLNEALSQMLNDLLKRPTPSPLGDAAAAPAPPPPPRTAPS